MSIIAFIVMFCWYMSSVGMSKMSLRHTKALGLIDEYKWYHVYMLYPAGYSYGFFKELISNVWQGMRMAVDDEHVIKVLSEEEGTE